MFVPATNFNGTVTIAFTVTDDDGATSAPADEVITVTDVNDPPVPVDPSNPGTPDNPIPANPVGLVPTVVANDGGTPPALDLTPYVRDPDGDPLTFTASGLPPGLSINPHTGVITGTLPPDASQNGPYTAIVTVTDPLGGTTTIPIIYTIANLPPVAADDTLITAQDTPVRIDVLANDHDTGSDRDALVVSHINGIPIDASHPVAVKGGVVSLNRDGSLTFTPRAGFVGSPSFTYTVSDGNGATATATVSVRIDEVVTHVPLPSTPTAPPIDPPKALPVSIQVSGIVLDAVNDIDHLGSTTGQIGVSGIVIDAVNRISPLGISTLNITEVSRPLEPGRLSEIWQGSSALGLGRPYFGGDPEGLTGFSLRMDLSSRELGGSSHSQIVVETLVRDRTLIVQMSNTSTEGGKRVAEYRVLQANGAPIPGWLDRVGSDLLIGQRPADVDAISLKIIVIYADGSFETKTVRIETMSGEINPMPEQRRAEALPFLQQFAARDQLAGEDWEEVAKALEPQ